MWRLIAINPWYRTLVNHTTGEIKHERYRQVFDFITQFITKNDDWTAGIGVGMVIGTLLALLLGMACFATDHALIHSLHQ